jgi:hypothetical protein
MLESLWSVFYVRLCSIYLLYATSVFCARSELVSSSTKDDFDGNCGQCSIFDVFEISSQLAFLGFKIVAVLCDITK